MGIFIKKIIIFFYLFIIFNNSIKGNQFDLDNARTEFLNGNFEVSIDIATKLSSIDAKIFQARAISVFTHFFKDGEISKSEFQKAYKISKNAIAMAPENAETYVEAAHALGRYGQKIGIMSAISEGIADRVKLYLDKALSIDNNNIIANLSKGIWHAEIINEAGNTLAKVLYGADASLARNHFEKVYHINNNEISVLFELSYGYHLLGKEDDLRISLKYIEEALLKKNKSYLDKLYKNKTIKLKNRITS